MPTKPEENAPENNGDGQESTLDPQKKYLMDQFGNLMEKVGDGFGGPLQEELINRLEQTIADFHEEVSEMMANLKENAEKRHEKLKEIWNNPDAALEQPSEPGTQAAAPVESDGEMSEWERKLEEAGKLDESSSDSKPAEEKEEAPKKKGLFGRKKK